MLAFVFLPRMKGYQRYLWEHTRVHIHLVLVRERLEVWVDNINLLVGKCDWYDYRRIIEHIQHARVGWRRRVREDLAVCLPYLIAGTTYESGRTFRAGRLHTGSQVQSQPPQLCLESLRVSIDGCMVCR